MINNTIIKQVTTTKFLGVEINTEAGWKEHISIINQKISRTIRVIRRVRTKLSIKTCMLLYDSLILSQLTYCNMIWASTYKTTLLKTYSLQKRALKLCFGRKFQNTRNNYQTVERYSLSIFKQANRLSVFDLNKCQIAEFVYHALNKISPFCFHKMFSSHHLYTLIALDLMQHTICLSNKLKITWENFLYLFGVQKYGMNYL